MILVIPISASDAHLLPEFTAAMLHCGPVGNHDIRIVPTACVVTQSGQLCRDLGEGYARTVLQYPLETDPHGGWPQACNLHWQKTMIAMWKEGCHTAPMYWMELDVTPIRKGWLDALQAEYDDACSPFMGAVVPTYRGPEAVLSGTHMVGTGIYPASWYNNPQAYMRIPPDEPWDVFFQDEIVPQGHNTGLICHRGKTANYRYQGTEIICDDKDMPPGVSYNTGPVPQDAVVVHGCKDGSLSRLIRGCGSQPVVEVPQKRKRGRPRKVAAVPDNWDALTAPP